MSKSCQVEGCRRKYHARGYCQYHYECERSAGRLALVRPYGRKGCRIEGCEGEHNSRGFCQKHYTRWQRHSDPSVAKVGVASDHPGWKGDDICYNSMHQRLRKYRGSARLFSCVDCGGGADRWSLRKEPGRYRIDEVEGWPYSTDLWDYDPRCNSCHSTYDIAHCRSLRGTRR